MSLSIFREGFDDVWIRFVSISLQRIEDHPKATIWHDGSLEWRFGLQTNDHFVLTIDITRSMGSDGTGNL